MNLLEAGGRYMLRVFHRYVWRSLPRNLRRSLLVWGAWCLAPRPGRVIDKCSDRVIVVGFLRTSSGLGESARLCYSALRAGGMPVVAIDLSSAMMQDRNRDDFAFEDGSRAFGSGTLIVHINAPWLPFALLLLGRRLLRGKRIVGYWHWELPVLPREWKAGFDFVDEIWVPSEFVAQAVRSSKGHKLVRVIPHPLVNSGTRTLEPQRRSGSEVFTVLVVFNMASGLSRKNPIGAVAAFRSAFANDLGARLIIKVTNAFLYAEGYQQLIKATAQLGNVELEVKSLNADEMNNLYKAADVVLSLHRSEGFGMVIVEAMLHGLPVVATNWSGNCDFLNVSNGMPVRYTLVPAFDPQGEYAQADALWAEPDIGDASEKLAILRRDPQLRTRLGRRAREDAVRLFGQEGYRQAVNDALGKYG